MFVFFNNISMYHMHDVDTVYDLPSKEHLILILGEKKNNNLKLPLPLTTPRFDSNFKIVFITILTSSKLGYKYVNNKSEYLDSNTFMN